MMYRLPILDDVQLWPSPAILDAGTRGYRAPNLLDLLAAVTGQSTTAVATGAFGTEIAMFFLFFFLVYFWLNAEL